MSEYINVPRTAVDWLKLYYPSLTVKAGLCEEIAGRVYTKTSLAAPTPTQVAETPKGRTAGGRCAAAGRRCPCVSAPP